MGEGLVAWPLGPLLCPASPPGTSTLHPILRAMCPGPSTVKCSEGSHTYCVSRARNLTSASAPHTLLPVHGPHPAPATGQRGHSLTREGRVLLLTATYTPGVRGAWGLCPPVLLFTPGLCRVMEDPIQTLQTRGQLACGCWSKLGPGPSPQLPPARARPRRLPLHRFAAYVCPPTTFLCLNNFLFLKDESYLVLIHKVSEVLGELLLHLPAQPLQGPRAEVSSDQWSRTRG